MESFRIKTSRRSIALVFTCLCLASVATADPAFDGWVAVESENFVVLSDEKPKQARRVAVHFERIRSLLAQQMPVLAASSGSRLWVYAPRNERSMKRLLDVDSVPAGLFRRTPDKRLVVVRADLLHGDGMGLVYHEYFHHLADYAGLSLPTWASEGLADVWGGGTRLFSKHAEAGRAMRSRLNALARGPFIPLEDQLAADRSSPLYRGSKKGQFYGQSWALAHMMLYDEEGTLREQLLRYLAAVGQGADSLEAAREIFGDLNALEVKMRVYSKRPTYRFTRFDLPPEPPDGSLRVREVSAGEMAARVARDHDLARSFDEIEALVDQALRMEPELATTQIAAGVLHLRREELDEGLAAFTRAVALPDAGAVPHYGLGVLHYRKAWTSEVGLDAEALARVEKHLLEALAVDRQLAPALARLARVYSLQDDGPRRALAVVRRAAELMPESIEVRLFEAEMLALTGLKNAAHEIVDTEVGAATASESGSLNNLVCWQGVLRGFADSVVPACERAVELRSDSAAMRDSRGVARALTGDIDGALIDLRAAVATADGWDESLKAKRLGWIEQLAAGENPIGAAGHRALASDPREEGIGWLR